MALGCYHHIGFIQHKYLDLLGVNELELGAPVQDCPGGANDNLLTDLLTSFHCGEEMFAEGISKEKSAFQPLRYYTFNANFFFLFLASTADLN